jgi:hypothetical protein
MWFPCLEFGLILLVIGNSFASAWTSSSSSLTLFSSQHCLFFQHDMISILHVSNCRHVDFVLNLISQAIDVLGNFFLVSLSLSNHDVQSIEILHVFLHSHSLPSQVLQYLEQAYLVIFGYEFSLYLGYHSIPTPNILFSLGSPISLQFIPP